MTLSLPSLQSPETSGIIFFAHRGASVRAPENSLTAFALAQQSFAAAGRSLGQRLRTGLAFDVQVGHRDTDGKREIVVVQARLPRPGGETPRLREVLDQAAGDNDVAFQIEIRRGHPATKNDGLEVRLFEELESHDLRQRVLVTSRDPLSLLRFRNQVKRRRLLSQYPIGLVVFEREWLKRSWWCRVLRPEALVLEFHAGMGRIIDGQRRAGRQVFIFTVNSSADIFAAVAAGADGVLSERPELLNLMPELARRFSESRNQNHQDG